MVDPQPKNARRFCVCGWSTISVKPHDHDKRMLEASIRAADAQCWTAHENAVERDG